MGYLLVERTIQAPHIHQSIISPTFIFLLFFLLRVSQQLIMNFICWLLLASYGFLANMDKVSSWSQTLSWIMFQFNQNSAAWSFLIILHSTFLHIFFNLFKVSHIYRTTSSGIRPITIVLSRRVRSLSWEWWAFPMTALLVHTIAAIQAPIWMA